MRVRCPHCHNPIELIDDSSLSDLHCDACDSNFNLVEEETVAESSIGLSLGRFEMEQKLGTGAFGHVWKARDSQLDRVVAVKIPRKGQLDALEAEQFIPEARAAAQLQHPNIVSVHEVGRQNDTLFIVSDFVDGVTLADWLSGQRLTARESVELCIKISLALHHAHEAGVVHRDLKPSNIMIDPDGEPHIMDFGLAKRAAGEITMTVEGAILGTPAYMSPEQAKGESHYVDRRTDVYSVGVILFELLTGERPFRGNSRMLMHQVIHEDPPGPRTLNGAVPKDLETICVRCLEKLPDKRFETAEEFASELTRFLDGHPIHSRPVTKLARLYRWCIRNPEISVLSLSILIVLAACISFSTYLLTDLIAVSKQ